MSERALSDTKMKQWISQRYNDFRLDQDVNIPNSAFPYRWRISKEMLSWSEGQNIATIHPIMVSTVCLFLLFWSFRLYCLELQALLPPSPFAVQFLCPFACVLAHDISFVGFSCFIGWSNNKQQPLSWSMSIMPCFCRCLLPDSIRLLPGLRRVCPTLY